MRLRPCLVVALLASGSALAWPAELFTAAGPAPVGARADVAVLRQGTTLVVTLGLSSRGPVERTLALLATPRGRAPKVALAAPDALEALDACTQPRLVELIEEDPCVQVPTPPVSSPRPGAPTPAVAPAPVLEPSRDALVALLPAHDEAALSQALRRAGFASSSAVLEAFRRLSKLGPQVTVLLGAPRPVGEERRLPPVQWTLGDTGAGLPLDTRDGGVTETQLWTLEAGLAVEVVGGNALLGEWPADGGVDALAARERQLLAAGDAVTEVVMPLRSCGPEAAQLGRQLGLRPESVEARAPTRLRLSATGAAARPVIDALGMVPASLDRVSSSVRLLKAPINPQRALDELTVAALWVATRLRVAHAGRAAEVQLRPAAPRADGTSALFGAERFEWFRSSPVLVRAIPARRVLRQPWREAVTCAEPRERAREREGAAYPRTWSAGLLTLTPAPSRVASPSLPALVGKLETTSAAPAWQQRYLEQCELFARQHAWGRALPAAE